LDGLDLEALKRVVVEKVSSFALSLNEGGRWSSLMMCELILNGCYVGLDCNQQQNYKCKVADGEETQIVRFFSRDGPCCIVTSNCEVFLIVDGKSLISLGFWKQVLGSK
jgi:uncharacterized membrane protein